MTEQELKDKYSNVVRNFLEEFDEAEPRAFGRNPLTGQYNKNQKQVLDKFRATNGVYKAIAANAGVTLNLVDTTTMEASVDNDVDLG